MARYDYRCEGLDCQRLTEATFPIAQFPPEIPCQYCQRPARRVITTVPYMAVDNTDRQGFDMGTGSYHSNKQERRLYMEQRGLVDISPEDAAKALQRQADARQERMDVDPSSRPAILKAIERDKAIRKGLAPMPPPPQDFAPPPAVEFTGTVPKRREYPT